jgi:hypothetical protein
LSSSLDNMILLPSLTESMRATCVSILWILLWVRLSLGSATQLATRPVPNGKWHSKFSSARCWQTCELCSLSQHEKRKCSGFRLKLSLLPALSIEELSKSLASVTSYLVVAYVNSCVVIGRDDQGVANQEELSRMRILLFRHLLSVWVSIETE